MSQTKPAEPAPLQSPLLTTDPAELGTPGVILVVDPATAEHFGAVPESALSLADAWAAHLSDERS